MKKGLLRKKSFQAVLVLALVLGVVLTATFAWYSFNQSKINTFTELVAPDTNLHDDFAGGPNKDVYVENSGQKDIFVRVRLTEFLQTENKGSLVENHQREEQYAKWWAPHNGVNPADDTDALTLCKLLGTDKTSAAWGTDNFHDYYSWIMGGDANGNAKGQIYYKPATADQKGEYDKDGNVIREPVVVSDPLTETSPKLDASQDYAEQVNALIATGKTEEEAMTALGLKKTQEAKVVSMKDWLNGTNGITKFEMGDFWVIDEEDGWCYWAKPLAGGTATGLLLDKVDRTTKPFDSNAEYCINVWLQAVDSDNLGRFEMAESGGISTNAKKLVQLATGKSALDTAGNVYANNGDGTYTLTTNADGTAAVDAKAFVVLNGTQGVNAPAESRIEIGQNVTITDMVWDGTDYEKWTATVANANNGWYNLTKAATPDASTYQLTGTQKGRDGLTYLMLTPYKSDGAGGFELDAEHMTYIGSVTKTGTTYSQANPGMGPYAIVYPGVTGLGGSGDSRLNPNVTLDTRNFYHMGNGVYVEVTEKGDTTSKDSPVKYYFAGTVLTSAKITAATGTTDEKVDALFPTQLAVGDKFDVTVNATTATQVDAYTVKTDGKYTMPELSKGVDGNLYLYLGTDKLGYLGVGGDNYLGNAGDTRRWAGKFGIGGTDDATTAPEDFNESFLKGITSEKLVAGKTFNVDGKTWIVLAVDEYGNRLIMSQNHDVFSAFGSGNTYQGSTLQTSMKNFTNSKVPTLKPYILDAVTPIEVTWSADMAVQTDALSSALATQNNPTAFVLSQSEFKKYDVQNKTPNNSRGSWFWTRTPATNGNVAIFYKDSQTNSHYSGYGPSNVNANFPAAWVRFSDADAIATASAEQMAKWKTGVPTGALSVGTNFSIDGYEWTVLEKDASDNLLITTTKNAYTTKANTSRIAWNYSGSLLETSVKNFYNNNLNVLKTYAKNATTGTETMPSSTSQTALAKWYTNVNDSAARSTVAANGSTAFVLSVSDLNHIAAAYPGGKDTFAKIFLRVGAGESYWLRTKGYDTVATARVVGVGNYTEATVTSQTNAVVWDAYDDSTYGVRPALWVNFN